MTAGSDGVLLHRFEERRLSFWWRAIDFVSENDVGEDRSLDEAETLATRFGIFFQDLCAGDIGRHEIGGELNASEGEVEGLRQRANEQGLGETGNADEKAVAAGEEPKDKLLDDLRLTDDDLADLGVELIAGAGQIGDCLHVSLGHVSSCFALLFLCGRKEHVVENEPVAG